MIVTLNHDLLSLGLRYFSYVRVISVERKYPVKLVMKKQTYYRQYGIYIAGRRQDLAGLVLLPTAGFPL